MPEPNPSLDEHTLALLACPACQGDLRLAEKTLACASCGRMYPVVDGIPTLIASRAISESK